MNTPIQPSRSDTVRQATSEFAVAASDRSTPDLYHPLSFLLAQVRRSLDMDVVFVSRFVDNERVFEVVNAQGELTQVLRPGMSDPLVDTYCQRVAQGRLPAIIADTQQSEEARNLAITQRLRIGAYLSAPVVLSNGAVFGTVCCISHRTRTDLHEADARALREVADAIAASVDHSGRFRFASWTPSDRPTH